MPAIYLTTKEKRKKRQLKIRAAAHERKIENEDASSTVSERARQALARVEREQAELVASIQARKDARKSKLILKKAQSQFHATCPAEDRETRIVEIRTALNALNQQGHPADAAKAYLMGLYDDLKAAIERDKEAAEAEAKALKETQESRDVAAGEKAANEILDKANVHLRKPMSLSVRAKLQARFKDLAQNSHKYAKTVTGFDSTGASRPAIALKIAATFEELVERIAVFTYDLDDEPSRDEMERRDKFFMVGCEPHHFNFRLGPGGTPTQEAALLRYAVARYYTEHGLDQFVDQLPRMPAPVHIPGPQESLEHVLFLEDQKRQSAAYREEETRKRIRDLERLRVEQPKEYAKLIEASRPLVFEEEPETVYRVETATVENPKSLPKFYWPDGTVCVLGRDIRWYAPHKCYVRTPEPVGYDAWPNSGGAKMEYVQDIRGDWVKQPVEINAGSVWKQDATGKWVETRNTATGQLRPPGMIEIVEGDHQPSPDDPRTFFRFGHWYSQQDIEAAERADSTFSLPALPQDTELPTVLDRAPDLDSKPETVWTRRERELLSKTEN